jgi:hypothetical protein
MPSPLVHSVLPASCLLLRTHQKKIIPRRVSLRLFFVGLVIANLPDLDIIPALLVQGHYYDLHRALGHNIFSLCLWTAVGAHLLRWAEYGNLRPLPKLEVRQWITSAMLASSHLLLDAIGHFGSGGFTPTVPIFWPLSQWSLKIPFRLFTMMDTGFHPPHLEVRFFSTDFWREVFFCEVIPSLYLFVAWMVITFVFDRLQGLRKKGGPPTLRDRPSPLTRF